MKLALLVYGPFTYVMGVTDFPDRIYINKPVQLRVLKGYMREENPTPEIPSAVQLLFQPVGFASTNILEYKFVGERG